MVDTPELGPGGKASPGSSPAHTPMKTSDAAVAVVKTYYKKQKVTLLKAKRERGWIRPQEPRRDALRRSQRE